MYGLISEIIITEIIIRFLFQYEVLLDLIIFVFIVMR